MNYRYNFSFSLNRSHFLLLLAFSLLLLRPNVSSQQLIRDLVFSDPHSLQVTNNNPFSYSQNSTTAFTIPTLEQKIAEGNNFRTVIGSTKKGRVIDAYFFRGKTTKRALVIGGVHGSEQSSVELAHNLVKMLSSGEKPVFSVLIIPCVFPDNAALAVEKNCEGLSGRYSSSVFPDPNRQMPPCGTAFDPLHPFDIYGREIEIENQYLLNIIQEFKPERIASLHAIRNISNAGFFADPRTDANGLSLGFTSDSLMAASMTELVCRNGGKVSSPSTDSLRVVYYLDPKPVPAGQYQPRNLSGSSLPGNRGNGISLGSWATTAVCDEEPAKTRKAISLITIEFPGYKSSAFLQQEEQFNFFLNLELYTRALYSVFLHY